MKKILIVDFHGLIFKGGMDDYIRPSIDLLPGVQYLTTQASSWNNESYVRSLVKGVRNEYAGIVAYGHSMGSKAASTITDDGPVDLLFLIDTAGVAPSRLGNNTRKAFDFQDTAFALVPKFRPQLVAGQPSSKLIRKQYNSGHIGITYNQNMVDLMVSEIRALVKAKGVG